MFGRQRLAVHGVRQQHLGTERLGHRDRRTVAEGLPLHAALVRTVEGDVQRHILLRSGGAQHVGQRDPGPFRIADRARTPGVAGGGPHALQVGPPVAGALHARHHRARGEPAAQVDERQVERRTDPPCDQQTVGRRIDLRDVAVTAHVEQVSRGDEAGAQLVSRWLGVVGLVRMGDETPLRHGEAATPRSPRRSRRVQPGNPATWVAHPASAARFPRS